MVLSRSAVAAVFVAGIALLVPVASFADRYTLDGVAVDQATALSGSLGGGCAAMPSPGGVFECYSTDGRRRQAIVDDMKADRLPPGFGRKPTADEKQRFMGFGASI